MPAQWRSLFTTIAFLAISTYGYFGSHADPKTMLSNQSQNSATVAQQQVGNLTVQTAPVIQNFGNQYFEPPSGILIPANTLIWVNFRLNASAVEFVSGSVNFFPFPNVVGANVTVAIYLDGTFEGSSTTPVPDRVYGIQSSLVPTSSSPNSVFMLTSLVPTVGVGTQSPSALNINGATLSVAVISDKPIWLAGWTAAGMSEEQDPQFGHSVGLVAGTYEASVTGVLHVSLPNALPQATTTLTFEPQIYGAFDA